MSEQIFESLLKFKNQAFLLIGEPVFCIDNFKNKLPTNSPDVWFEVYDSFSIEDAKKLKTWQSTKPVGEKKYAILGINTANIEAQNSLLKLTEEPTEDTLIVFVVPNEGLLIPTLISRLVTFYFDQTASHLEEDLNFCRLFLQSDSNERMEMIGVKFDYEDELIKNNILNFLGICEYVIQREVEKGVLPSGAFKQITESRRDLSGRSTVARLVLESLAVTLPRLN